MTAAVSACASASKVHVARNGGIQHTGTQPKMRRGWDSTALGKQFKVSGKTAKQRPVSLLVSNFQLPQGCNGSFEAMRQELSVIQKVSSKLQFVSLNESG